jgi:hypothetical protein
MEVALVLLYVVVGVCGASCIGMGIIVFMDWKQDRSWRKSRESFVDVREEKRKEINEAIAFNKKNGTYDFLEHYSNKIDLE